MASVSPDANHNVAELLIQLGLRVRRELTVGDLQLDVHVREPQRVGIDRLLGAVAVNRVRQAERAAIVIDLGTAVTVDVIDPHGSFLGGAILPGWSLSASALYGGTSSLPLLTPNDMVLPDEGLGKCTTEAIAAGLTWGLIGAVEKLANKYSHPFSDKPQLFLTGGDAPMVIDELKMSLGPVRHISHLVLAGIAIACEGDCDSP